MEFNTSKKAQNIKTEQIVKSEILFFINNCGVLSQDCLITNPG